MSYIKITCGEIVVQVEFQQAEHYTDATPQIIKFIQESVSGVVAMKHGKAKGVE